MPGTNSVVRDIAGHPHAARDRRASSEPVRKSWSEGDRIGQYECIRELGRGGMGAVFLARDLRLGRLVAIKSLHSDSEEQTKRFIREARTTAQCQHENIVVIYDVGEHLGSPFMVLEYLRGTPLSELMHDGRSVSGTRAVEWMVPVVRALVQAHEHNIVHRDLKPDNIIVTESGSVKVLDFGIAKLLDHEPTQGDIDLTAAGSEMAMPAPATGLELAHSSMTPPHAVGDEPRTRRGALVGTLPYMSPEQWGVAPVDHRTDIWAVGIMLFELLAGKHPLAPRRGRALGITGLLDHPMPGIQEACPGVSRELAEVVDRCLRKPKEQRFDSARGLLEALEALLPGRTARRLRSDEHPYAGLNSFQETDAQRFFGRSHEIASAVARLRHGPLLAVVGPSGVGKSSFVRAGLVPALKQSGDAWTAQVLRPGRAPMGEIADLLTNLVGGVSRTDLRNDLLERDIVLQRLHAEPGLLGTVMRSEARRTRQRILLFVDQFEELFTLGADEAERRAFTACLASVADDPATPTRVVLSLRSDFLDRVPEDRRFMNAVTPGLFFLTPPDRDGLREALVQPADMAGYQFESTTTIEHMLDHLEQVPGSLPLLQFAATKLWEARNRERRLLTDESYRQFGGIAGALASHADAVIAEFSSGDRNLIRDLFLRLVTPERTRAIVSIEEIRTLVHDPQDIERLLGRLSEARLLVIQTDDAQSGGDGSVTVEIVHESLLHSWPRLQRWLDQNQEHALFLEQLRTAAKQWQAKNHSPGLLWRGEPMEEARHWRRRYTRPLPRLEQAYLDAVFQLASRSVRHRRLVLGSVITVLSLMVAASAVALVLIRTAQRDSARQASLAQTARQQVTLELERTQAAKRQVERAEQRALEAREEALMAKAKAEAAASELATKNRELQQREHELERTLRRANRHRRKLNRQAIELKRARDSAIASKFQAEKKTDEALAARNELLKQLRKYKIEGVLEPIPTIDNLPWTELDDELEKREEESMSAGEENDAEID